MIVTNAEVDAADAEELWERVHKEWSKIKLEVCQEPIEIIHRQAESVIKGGYTNY